MPGLPHHPGLFITVSIQFNSILVSTVHALCTQPSCVPLCCEDWDVTALTSLVFNNSDNKLLAVTQCNLTLLMRFNSEVTRLDSMYLVLFCGRSGKLAHRQECNTAFPQQQ